MEMLTRKQVMQIFGISCTTLYRWMSDGRIKYYKTGDKRSCKVLFYKKDIEEFLRTIKG